ncbi:MAG: metallophosphoesterase [Clostridia bacterium]|nr:metallophosphoesterase [Clostridia bacterium]
MKLYTVADPHGFLDEMKTALNEQGFFDDPEGKLVVCGDVLDRGKKAVEMADFLITLLKEDRLIYVRGNHEDLLERCLQDIVGAGFYEIKNGSSYHCRNGTWDTLLQLANMEERLALKYPEVLCRRVMESPFYETLLPSAVNYYEPENLPIIFVHGWIPCQSQGCGPFKVYSYDPHWRLAPPDIWERARWLNGMDMACNYHAIEPNKTIVCGHFHTSWGHAHINKDGSEWGEDAKFSPFEAEGILALDACTAYSHKVNCRVFRI